MNILINEPGGFGDVIICLPIAKWFEDRGHFVAWRAQKKCFPILQGLPYIGAVTDLPTAPASGAYKVIDLELGSDRVKEKTQKWVDENRISFDEWKYAQAGVPIEEKFKLEVRRNPHREANLLHELIPDTFKYHVVHQQGSQLRHEFSVPDDGCAVIEIKPRANYTIYDWIAVIEGAESGWFVNSSIANLVNGLGLLKGRRYFRPWWGHDGHLLPIKQPKLDEEWEIVN